MLAPPCLADNSGLDGPPAGSGFWFGLPTVRRSYYEGVTRWLKLREFSQRRIITTATLLPTLMTRFRRLEAPGPPTRIFAFSSVSLVTATSDFAYRGELTKQIKFRRPKDSSL